MFTHPVSVIILFPRFVSVWKKSYSNWVRDTCWMDVVPERGEMGLTETTVVYAMWSRCSTILRKRGRGGRRMVGLRDLRR